MLAVAALAPLCVVVGCSSSSSNAPPPFDAGPLDAGDIDGSLGPFLCNLPVPATCPTTAPCTFAAWDCSAPVCDGYFVITDGTWIYYYSSPGGELAGEVAVADSSFVACPYAFVPPASCPPVVAGECSSDGGGE